MERAREKALRPKPILGFGSSEVLNRQSTKPIFKRLNSTTNSDKSLVNAGAASIMKNLAVTASKAAINLNNETRAALVQPESNESDVARVVYGGVASVGSLARLSVGTPESSMSGFAAGRITDNYDF